MGNIIENSETTPKLYKLNGKRQPGRKLSITPKITQIVKEALEDGQTIKTACQMSGICVSTFYQWMDKGEEGREEYVEFMETVKRAEPVIKKVLLDKIKNAEQWQAAAWILERRFSDEWGKTDRLEISGRDGEAIKVKQELANGLRPDEIENIVKVYEKVGIYDRLD